MFVPSESLSFGLIVMAMFFWGSWTYIRCFCAAETPVFCQLYFIAQILIAFFFCVTLGDATSSDNNNKYFNDIQFSTAILNAGAPSRIAAIIIGGHLNANADFLCALACSKLPFGVAFPVYAGWGLAQGTLLNFLCIPNNSNPIYLFFGVFFALLAIGQLAYSDSYDKKRTEDNQSSQNVESPIHPGTSNSIESKSKWAGEDYEDTTVVTLHLGSPDSSSPSQSAPASPSADSAASSPEESRRWIYVCVFAGVLNGLWSPLSSIGTSGDGAVTNSFVSLFLFQCGQFSAVPVFLTYFGQGKVFPPHYIKQLCLLPFSDILFGLLAGTSVGMGFTLYFIASSVISPSISFAIGACCPIFTILLGVIFARQLAGASRGKTLLLFGSVCCYAVAITLIASSKDK